MRILLCVAEIEIQVVTLMSARAVAALRACCGQVAKLEAAHTATAQSGRIKLEAITIRAL